MKTLNLTYEKLNKLFAYDPDSGSLTWRDRPRSDFRSNAAYAAFSKRFANKAAGCASYRPDHTRKALVVNIEGRTHKAHRIAWVLAHKRPIPDDLVLDHANGNPFDNKLKNLRLCTQSENGRNCKVRKHNISGFKGVSAIPSTGRFTANISNEGKREYIGSFATEEEAQTAYLNRAKEICGEFAKV